MQTDPIHMLLRSDVDDQIIQQWFGAAHLEDVLQLLDGLCSYLRDADPSDDNIRLDPLLRCFVAWWTQPGKPMAETWQDTELVEKNRQLYDLLGPESKQRHHLLIPLANSNWPEDLDVLMDLLIGDPPLDESGLAQIFACLLRAPVEVIQRILPRLLTGLDNPKVASFSLDLVNYIHRHYRLEAHPARGRVHQLTRLLDGIVSGLEKLQASNEAAGVAGSENLAAAASGLPLVVGLCDALGLIGDSTAIPVLQSALDLKHRRVRTEAAAALARLGDETGTRQLIALAEEPIARLRVVSYAEELDLYDQLPEQYTGPGALAQAELVSYLASPNQFGVPPTSCELLDSRTLYWPSFEEPRDCYLFRYSYQSIDGETTSAYTNIGIAGPLAHCLRTNLCALDLDDVYAIFAGWQVEHEEIFEQEFSTLRPRDRPRFDRLLLDMEAADYTEVLPKLAARFFGDDVVVASAKYQQKDGFAVCDHAEIAWFPAAASQEIAAVEAIWIYKGRRLLRSFNG